MCDVLYVFVNCFVVCGCAVSRRYINICNCDMIGVVNVYLDDLKFCVVCINDRRYVCCSRCNVVFNACNEPTSCLVQPIGAQDGEVICPGCVFFRCELGFLNCADICMCVVNKQYVLIPFMLTCNMMRILSLLLLGLCPCIVSVGKWSSLVSVRLSWYHMWMRWLL